MIPVYIRVCGKPHAAMLAQHHGTRCSRTFTECMKEYWPAGSRNPAGTMPQGGPRKSYACQSRPGHRAVQCSEERPRLGSERQPQLGLLKRPMRGAGLIAPGPSTGLSDNPSRQLHLSSTTCDREGYGFEPSM